MVLAIFLSFWTWCYTYRANAAKFWTGLILCCIGAMLSFLIIPLMLNFAVWFWAIIDATTASDSFYRTGVR
ncbi:MAG: hypothetical protein JST73_05145 [Actinobacteria bacterium]|nr:hypothetical protein [Actinomycetota bacterium]